MVTRKDDLEPIKPSNAQDLFLEHKSTSCTEATVKNHEYRTNHFVRWCNEEGIDNLNALSGRDIQKFRLWRQADGDLNDLTLRMQMSTLRVLLKWAGSIEAVPEDLYNKVMIPRVRPEERHRDETLESDDAEAILEYLRKYEYGSVEHVLISLLWETGIRLGAAQSIDLVDIDLAKEKIELEHRPEQGTTLKNGQSGERPIAISAEMADLIDNYIEKTRSEVVDDNDREALFTTVYGRMHENTMRRVVYRVTAPCYRGEECPNHNESETKCPEAVSPHAVRRGSITHFLTNDVPVEIVSDRMNVSRKILDKHYDKRSEEVKLEQRRQYLDNI